MHPHTDPLPGAPALIAASSAALASLIPVALYQFGVIPRLPDPPARIFNSERIVRSRSAHILGLPDSVPGLASYGITLGLVLAARRRPRIRPLLAAKLAGDGAIAVTKAATQVIQLGRLCSWCLVTTACTAAMVYSGRRLLAQSASCAAGDVRRVAAQLISDESPSAEPVLDALLPHA
jgi:uncharacterized membrane protein